MKSNDRVCQNDKSTKVIAKNDQFGDFLKTWRLLSDRSTFIEQKLVDNAKIENIKWDILANFQTMWGPLSSWQEIRDQSHLFKKLDAI